MPKTASKIHCGYVVSESGLILLQVPDDNRWGFYLCDDDQSWDGGFGVSSSWEAIGDDDPRITEDDRERLADILNEVRNS